MPVSATSDYIETLNIVTSPGVEGAKEAGTKEPPLTQATPVEEQRQQQTDKTQMRPGSDLTAMSGVPGLEENSVTIER